MKSTLKNERAAETPKAWKCKPQRTKHHQSLDKGKGNKLKCITKPNGVGEKGLRWPGKLLLLLLGFSLDDNYNYDVINKDKHTDNMSIIINKARLAFEKGV